MTITFIGHNPTDFKNLDGSLMNLALTVEEIRTSPAGRDNFLQTEGNDVGASRLNPGEVSWKVYGDGTSFLTLMQGGKATRFLNFAFLHK